MKNIILLAFMIGILAAPAWAAPSPLPPEAQKLFHQAQQEKSFEKVAPLRPAIFPTSDGKSFYIVWKPGKEQPKKWMVSLHGSNGFATTDLSVWHPVLVNHDIGFIGLQWWFGQSDKTEGYYTPDAIYRELTAALHQQNIAPGNAMLQGFSRGSANIYGVEVLDATSQSPYFSLVIANSGGASLDYPPTHAIDAGQYGPAPFKNTNWITVCGEKDPHPERDGCPAMQRTDLWLASKGANVIGRIEDKNAGHGALNTNPKNAEKVLEIFESQSHSQ